MEDAAPGNKYRIFLKTLRQRSKNSSKFNDTLVDLHWHLSNEEDPTSIPEAVEVYDWMKHFYEIDKYKQIRKEPQMFILLADIHYYFEEFAKARELYHKGIQSGKCKFDDDDDDIHNTNIVGEFYKQTCETPEQKKVYLRDIDKLIKGCYFPKGAVSCLLHYHKGQALLELSKPDEALTSFRLCLKYLPDPEPRSQHFTITRLEVILI